MNISLLDHKVDTNSLFNFLENINHIHSLNLGNNFSEDGMDQLAQYLFKSTTVKYLNLENNNLKSLSHLKEYLFETKTLETLNLRYNHLDAKELEEILKMNKSITNLNLFQCGLNLEKESIKFNFCLRFVNLSGNRESDLINKILNQNQQQIFQLYLLLTLIWKETNTNLSLLPRRLYIYFLKFLN